MIDEISGSDVDLLINDVGELELEFKKDIENPIIENGKVVHHRLRKFYELDGVDISISECGDLLSELLNDLNEIKRVENHINGQMDDIEDKIKTLSNHVDDKNSHRFIYLKKAIESSFKGINLQIQIFNKTSEFNSLDLRLRLSDLEKRFKEVSGS